MLLESKAMLSKNVFHTYFLFQKLDCHKITFSNDGDSNLAIWISSTRFSISGIRQVITHNFTKSRPRDGLAAQGLL